MIQIIAGEKGKGKTKILLDKANAEVLTTTGTLAFIDKNNRHMYELNNKIRLIDVSRFPLRDSSEFIGFICGILSQDHDLEVMFLDSYLALARIDDDEAFAKTVSELENISKQYGVRFVLSISKDKEEIPEQLQGNIQLAL